MPISVTCTGCQSKFAVKDELAGKRVACPKCKAPLTIPTAPPPPVAPPAPPVAAGAKIRVECVCGAAMQVDAALTGKMGKCPKCGQPVRIVPAPPAAASKASPLPRPASAAPTAKPSKPLPPSKGGERPRAPVPSLDDDESTPSGGVKLRKAGGLFKLVSRLAGNSNVNWVRLGIRGGIAAALLIGAYIGWGYVGQLTGLVGDLANQAKEKAEGLEMPDVDLPFGQEAEGDAAEGVAATPAGPPAADAAIQAIVSQHGADKVVTLVIADQLGNQSRVAYEAALKPLADSQPAGLYLQGGGPKWEATLAPVADVAALAEKITFAQVAPPEPESRKLMLTVTQALPVPPPPGGAPTAPPQDPIAAALAKVQSTDPIRQAEGARDLEPLAPDARQREVAAALELLLQAKENGTREASASALKTWADEESVPALLAALEDMLPTVRHAVLRTFGQLKDPRTPEAVAKRMLVAEDLPLASQCLKDMGAISEKPAIGLLRNDEHLIREHACRILQLNGGQPSLGPLRKLAQSDPNPGIRHVASEALTVVSNRVSENRRRPGR